MRALTITLKLESRVLITSVDSGDENSARTLAYIPGGALRGALIARYQAERANLPFDKQARRLFLGGNVRYLNAYPEIRGIRTLPVPASWRVEKNADLSKGTATYDCAWGTSSLESPEGIGRAFCRVSGEEPVEVLDPVRTVSIHMGGEERGTVREGNNTVFRYEALGAGQTFSALVVADDSKDLDLVKALLDKDSRLAFGGSRSAEYGQARIQKVAEVTDEAAPPADAEPWVTITLLSDAMLRDDDGQPTLDLDTALSRRLGRSIRHVRAFVNTARVGGFNRHWALPLPQGTALAMGSVFVYPSSEVTAGELQALVTEGVGERRVEGFGRIAVNWPGQEELTIRDVFLEEPPLPPKTLSVESQALAQRMAEGMMRAWLDEALLEMARRWEVQGHIPNHQLSRLRAVVRGALMSDAKPLAPVSEYFSEMRMREAARRLFDRARVGVSREHPERLSQWVLDRAANADGLSLIGVAEHRAPVVAEQNAAWDDRLKREYTLRLIDAVLRRAMRANREKGG